MWDLLDNVIIESADNTPTRFMREETTCVVWLAKKNHQNNNMRRTPLSCFIWNININFHVLNIDVSKWNIRINCVCLFLEHWAICLRIGVGACVRVPLIFKCNAPRPLLKLIRWCNSYYSSPPPLRKVLVCNNILKISFPKTQCFLLLIYSNSYPISWRKRDACTLCFHRV